PTRHRGFTLCHRPRGDPLGACEVDHMSTSQLSHHPDTGLHDLRKLAEQHRARQEAREAEESLPIATPTPLAAVPVKAVAAPKPWLRTAVLGGALLVGGGVLGVVALRMARTPAAAVAAAVTAPQSAPPIAAVSTQPAAQPNVEPVAPAPAVA